MLRQNFALLSPKRKTIEGGVSAELKDEHGSSDSVFSSQSSARPQTPLAAGTYELAATDDVAPVAPGAVRIDAPTKEQVILSAAMRLAASVAEGWGVALEVDGVKVNNAQIGERRADHKNKVSTYTFVGVNVRPGLNRLKVTAISPKDCQAVRRS